MSWQSSMFGIEGESLEGQLAKAQARGDAAAIRKAEEAIEARRSWLVEAERTLAEFSG